MADAPLEPDPEWLARYDGLMKLRERAIIGFVRTRKGGLKPAQVEAIRQHLQLSQRTSEQTAMQRLIAKKRALSDDLRTEILACTTFFGKKSREIVEAHENEPGVDQDPRRYVAWRIANGSSLNRVRREGGDTDQGQDQVPHFDYPGEPHVKFLEEWAAKMNPEPTPPKERRARHPRRGRAPVSGS
jgi:hypothetical protein